MPAVRAGRGLRYAAGGISVAAVAIAAGLWFTHQPQVEVSPSQLPDPIAPFGPVTRAELVFRWAVPEDRAPVRVEVLDAQASSLAVWVSDPVGGDSLKPQASLIERWPLDDLLWRPVAVAAGQERAGELAAFTLLP